MRSPAGHSSTSLHLEEVSFELYSHATDPVRSVESVHTVAGIPLTLQQGKLGEFCNRTQHEDVSNQTSYICEYVPAMHLLRVVDCCFIKSFCMRVAQSAETACEDIPPRCRCFMMVCLV